jgi:hypothetical protein
VENFVDELRECRPSAGSTEEFYEMITKSPSQMSHRKINDLGAPSFGTDGLCPVFAGT